MQEIIGFSLLGLIVLGYGPIGFNAFLEYYSQKYKYGSISLFSILPSDC